MDAQHFFFVEGTHGGERENRNDKDLRADSPSTRHLQHFAGLYGRLTIRIGPSDLPLPLGCKPVFDDVDSTAQQAIQHVVTRAKAHGVVVRIHKARAGVVTARVGLGCAIASSHRGRTRAFWPQVHRICWRRCARCELNAVFAA